MALVISTMIANEGFCREIIDKTERLHVVKADKVLKLYFPIKENVTFARLDALEGGLINRSANLLRKSSSGCDVPGFNGVRKVEFCEEVNSGGFDYFSQVNHLATDGNWEPGAPAIVADRVIDVRRFWFMYASGVVVHYKRFEGVGYIIGGDKGHEEGTLQLKLAFPRLPKFISRVSEGIGKPRYEGGSYGGDRSVVAFKETARADEKIRSDMVGGAIFWVGMFALFANFILYRAKQ
jgi:hypothetical protein